MNKLYFIFIIIPVILLNVLADKKSNKKILFLSIVVMSLIIGMRGITVGIDTKDYYYAFINNFPRSWQFEEAGFRFISRILMNIFQNATIVVLVYAFITNLLIMMRLWDFKDKGDFSLMSTIYIFVFTFSMMNVMRQILAVAIIFYFSRFLEKKKYFIYIIAVILASLIHKTALVVVLFPVLYMWNGWTKNKKILAIIPLFILYTFIVYYVFTYENDHINNYLSSDRLVSNVNITFMYRFFIFCISYILFKMKIKFVYKNKLKNKEILNINYSDKQLLNISAIIYFMGLCLASLGMFYDYVARIGFYFLIYEPVYWGLLSKASYNKELNTTMIMVYSVYVFMFEIIGNGSGVFPYYWNI